MTDTTSFKRVFVLSTLIAMSSGASAWAAPEPADQVQGFYSKNGKLEKASSIVAEGKGIVHVFVERHRGFGSLGMVELLEKAASGIADLFPGGERLQVADIAAEGGGLISMHASHQNGLDADVIYYRMNHQEYPPAASGMTEVFVKNGKITPNFDVARNFKVLSLITASGRVNRIFVDPVIKKTLCAYAATHASLAESIQVLGHLQPYADHDNHFHVRISCPKESPNCQSQPPLNLVGTGCSQIPNSPGAGSGVPFDDHGSRDEDGE